MDINELITQTIASLNENTLRASGIEHQKQDLMNETIQGISAASDAAVNVNQQKMLGDYQAQENAIATRQALGNDINDPNSLLGILVQDFRESSIAARTQQAEIAAKQQVTLFDDPLQYLVNYVTLPDEINAAKATQGKADMAAQTIQNMQALTTASAQAQKATAQTLTKQSMADAAIVQRAELDAKVNALKIDSLSYDSNAIKLLNDSNAQTLQWEMARHNMALQDAAALRASQEHQMRMAKFKEAEMDDQQYAKIIGIGAAAYGLPAPNLDSIKLMMKSPAQKAKLDRFLDQGFSTIATGSNSVGATPGEAIVNTLEVNGLPNQQNRPTRDFLSKIARDAFANYETKNGKVTKMTDAVRAGVAANVDEILFGPTNPKTGKRLEQQGLAYKMYLNAEAPGSLIKAADLPQLINLPAVKSNPLYSTVLLPAAEAGITSSNPEEIYKLAAAARDKGLLNDKQMAMGVADLYKAAGADAYASRGLGKFGMPYRPSYLAEATSVFSFDPSQKDRIDWARAESVLSYDVARKSRLAYSSNYKAQLSGNAAMRGQ